MSVADRRTDSEKFGDDRVKLPPHYLKYPIEPVRFLAENGIPFLEANVIKYLLRHRDKNGMEDLRKAQRYLEMLIKRENGDVDWWR